ncbi:MAG: class I SAM-dependent methyltransferase [Anaerolineales bacterium]|nr:MAG: class I SAM-dependent methyltransferase [Anaerolineales bacterium]
MDRRFWSWHLSALFYERTYNNIAHQLDEDLFSYLGDRTRGALVVDCGCGPGIVTQKFLQREAARVLAVDVNAGMLRQVRLRLADAVSARRVVLVRDSANVHLFSRLRDQYPDSQGFDIILFKRSLYVKPERALAILRAAVTSLRPGGVLVIVHGERSLRRYAFGPGLGLKHYTLYHLFNRTISTLGEKLGIGDYTLYTQNELIDLLRVASPGQRVELIPSQQRAYNLVAAFG